MKKIHWKLSSKMNELLVKNFEGSSHASSAILLDLKKSNRSFEENSIIEDMLIEASIAVIYYCLVNWIPIILYITTVKVLIPSRRKTLWNLKKSMKFYPASNLKYHGYKRRP